MLRTTHFGGIIMMFFVQEKKLRHRGQRNAHGVSVKSYQQLGWRIVPGICVLPGLHALRSVCSWVCVLPSFLRAVLLCLTGFQMTFISAGWHTQEKMIIWLSWRSYEEVAEEMARWLRELAILESTVSFQNPLGGWQYSLTPVQCLLLTSEGTTHIWRTDMQAKHPYK